MRCDPTSFDVLGMIAHLQTIHPMAQSAIREFVDGRLTEIQWLYYFTIVQSDNFSIAECVMAMMKSSVGA